jgi:hypothetical protein
MQTFWFQVKGTGFIACAKIGPQATSGDSPSHRRNHPLAPPSVID